MADDRKACRAWGARLAGHSQLPPAADLGQQLTPPPGPTLPLAMEQAARAYGPALFMRRVAEDQPDQDFSRHQFMQMALGVAAWCLQAGLAPGDRVLLCRENGPEWGAVYFGALAAGGVIVPVDTASTPKDLAHYLALSQARLVFTSDPAPLRSVLPEGATLAPPMGEVLDTPPLPVQSMHHGQAQDLACLIFTSGTTGQPKAVMLTHANLLANVASIARLHLVRADDNFLAVLPMHHAYPCMVNLILPLLLGGRTTFLAALKPEALLGALKTQGISLLVLTPQYVEVFRNRILARLAGLPLGLGHALARLLRATSSLSPDPLALVRTAVRKAIGPRFRFFVTGGAKADPQILADMSALGVYVLEGYGLSETAPVISFNPPGNPPGSVGRPLPGVTVRIDRPDEAGVGEICVRGPNVTPGYFNNPDASAKALVDGWFHTGDNGRLDQDGFLFVHGRERDILVLQSGKKVSAEEVENHYLQAPSIAEIGVVLNPQGELAAIITPDEAHFKTLDAPDIRANIRWDIELLSKDLPAYKRIKRFDVTSAELPRTRLGKLKRHLLEQMLAAKPAPGQAPADLQDPLDGWPHLTPAEAAILAALVQVAGQTHIAPNAHLELDLGLDSLRRLELLTAIEEATGLTLPEEHFLRLTTARQVLELAESGSLPASPRPPGDTSATLSAPAASAAPAAQPPQTTPAAQPPQTTPAAQPPPAWTAQLKAPLPQALAERVRLKATWFDSLLARLGAWALWPATRFFFHLSVRGTQHIPDGPAILCANHASYLDGFMVFAATPARLRTRLYFLGLARFFDSRPVRPFAARLRLIPVDAGRILEMLKLTAHVLRSGQLACVFPEGSRSVTGKLMEFRDGAAILARELDAPIVPVAIRGAFAAWPPGGALKPARISVEFAAPIPPEDIRRHGMDAVRREVARMLGEEEKKREEKEASGGQRG